MITKSDITKVFGFFAVGLLFTTSFSCRHMAKNGSETEAIGGGGDASPGLPYTPFVPDRNFSILASCKPTKYQAFSTVDFPGKPADTINILTTRGGFLALDFIKDGKEISNVMSVGYFPVTDSKGSNPPQQAPKQLQKGSGAQLALDEYKDEWVIAMEDFLSGRSDVLLLQDELENGEQTRACSAPSECNFTMGLRRHSGYENRNIASGTVRLKEHRVAWVFDLVCDFSKKK